MAAIPLFPLNTVLFPDGRLPLQIFEVRYLDMVRKCIAHSEEFGVVPLLEGEEVRKPGQHEALGAVGTLARIVEWSAPMPGLMQIQCLGTHRFRLLSAEQGRNGLWMGEVERVDDDMAVPVPGEQQDVANALGSVICALQHRHVSVEKMPMQAPYRLDESGWVANRWCELLHIATPQKQLLLAQDNPVLRLELVQDLLSEAGLLS
ncbi:LON peptidase substrate-binding domain-containing protein [Massilia endophytica]|uniref:LON peptidase substrate-binding domain-containing protein n=1 Tax=Massilia endophytica TaxID=2899220 RepID=UPI001E5D0955|nr:LON peptidase substrate-binding domain-containing protein [Massilia endophytica]UGQ48289.1 LON peptidase substrate-binding domain-containing protein [Massilia endophytica]